MPSRKRLKLDVDISTECAADVVAELDLEISLRRRLAETIESRMAWARLLQEALEVGSSGASISFKDAAFESLATIERPLNVLLEREIHPIQRSNPHQPPRISRPLPNKQNLERNSNANFLYIKSGYLQPPFDDNHVQTYLIRCPSCLRRKFTSLQGLLNHARLSHGLEWGTHEECVRACIVVDPDLHLEEGIEVGAGPNGLLPGLRSLFEMAVGVHQQPRESNLDLKMLQAENLETVPTSSRPVSTLGLHEDTPALAHFLGKQATRRIVEVWDNQHEVIDVDGFEKVDPQDPRVSSNTSLRSSWKMHFTRRNDFEEEQSTIQAAESAPQDVERHISVAESGKSQPPVEPNNPGVIGTRFHFVARIVVTDRSHWISPEKRSGFPVKHTHKWMISVDAPSYSYHITSILKQLTVSSLSGPAFSPLSTASPPFVIIGTADEAFLAKVELHFNGTPTADGSIGDQTVELEHWVELDLVKSATPVTGEEQVVDIELDKKTVLLPIRKGYIPVGAKVLWSQTSEALQTEELTNLAESIPTHRKILNSLVMKFPMTLRGPKGGRQSQRRVPYKLVPMAEFEEYVVGRRKAIEWSRACAIQGAYVQEINEHHSTALDHIPLRIGDVYRWLSEEGHLIRSADVPNAKTRNDEKISRNDEPEPWCPACGMCTQVHTAWTNIKDESFNAPLTKMEACLKPEHLQPGKFFSSPFTCKFAPNIQKLPMLNVRSQFSKGQSLALGLDGLRKVRFGDIRGAALISSVHPKLIMATYDIVHSLKLPSFELRPLNNLSPYPLDQLGQSQTQLITRLAPFALLSVAVKSFLRVLVEGGLQLAKAQKSTYAQPAKRKRKHDAPDESIERSALTPAHILQSIILRARGPPLGNRQRDIAIYECLADIGVSPTYRDISILQDDTREGESQNPVSSIKQEDYV